MKRGKHAKSNKWARGKHAKSSKRNKRRSVIIILLSILIISSIYLVKEYYNSNKNRKIYEKIETEKNMTADNKFVENVKKLKKENSDVKAWIRIGDTNINYPILQTTNNEFYATHNYKKEETKYGSIFINYNSDLEDINSNVIIYGHNMKDKQMFGDLLKYQDESFYKTQPTIKIATIENELEYEIITTFKSRIFYNSEKDVFRYYQYYNFENEREYNEYLDNCKKIQLYDTGVEANYGEQIITLITCEYSQENGRMVVVAKRKI